MNRWKFYTFLAVFLIVYGFFPHLGHEFMGVHYR